MCVQNSYCISIKGSTQAQVQFSFAKFFGKSWAMVLFGKKRETSPGETRTWMSSFVLFLIKYCFIPISIEKNDKIVFNIFSWKTCIHCCVSLGYMIIISAIVLNFTSINPRNFYIADTSFAVNFSFTLMGFSNMFGILVPLLISDGLTSLNLSFITNKNLRVPPQYYRVILGKLRSVGRFKIK